MPEISLFALIGEASIYTVFPGLAAHGIMYFIKRHIANKRAIKQYIEMCIRNNIGDYCVTPNCRSCTRLAKHYMKQSGDTDVIKTVMSDVASEIDSQIESLAEEPKVEPLKPAYTVMFRVLKGKQDACELYHSFLAPQYNGKKYKTDRLSMSHMTRILSNTKLTIFRAKWQKKLQILTVYPPTKTRKNWYISVQKYDEEGNKTDLDKAHLNKGSTFVYGYDIEVKK